MVWGSFAHRVRIRAGIWGIRRFLHRRLFLTILRNSSEPSKGFERLTRRGTQWLRRCKSLHVGVRQVSVAVIEVRMHVGTHRSENAVTRPTCKRNAGFPFCSRRIDQEGRLALKTAPAVSQQALKTGDSHCRARSMGANRAWLIANR